MSKAKRAALRARAKKVGAKVTFPGDCITVDVPDGFIIAGPELHYLDVFFGDGEDNETEDEAIEFVMGDLEDGIKPCPNQECENCT